MIQWGWRLCLCLGVAVTLARAGAEPGSDPLPAIREAHARVRDLVLEVVRKEVREDELRRMKRSATTALEFSRIKVYFKAPDRLRLEGRYGLVPVTMVENGNTKLYRFGMGIQRRRDVTGDPGKKQGGLEFGLLSGEVWQDYVASVLGREQWEGRPAIVIELTARADRDGSRHKIWVDAETFRLMRRDRLTGEGKLKHRHVFREPYRTPAGTWLSRRIEILNQYGRYVGALELRQIEVNQGLADSLFKS